MDSISRMLFAKYLGVLMDAAVGIVVEGDLISIHEGGAVFMSWDLIDGSYVDD